MTSKVVSVEVTGSQTFGVGDHVRSRVQSLQAGVPGVVVEVASGIYVVCRPHLGQLAVVSNSDSLTLERKGGIADAAQALATCADAMQARIRSAQ